MSACKFELGRRVIIPGTKVQGIIVARSESKVEEARYLAQWLGDDLKIAQSGFSEAELVAAEAEHREGVETAAVKRLGIIAEQAVRDAKRSGRMR